MDIETYFKLTKSYLRLRTECHRTSYDVNTSHMVIVAIQYMILAVERFKNSDDRSIEELFYGVQREIVNEPIDCAIVLMIDTLLDSIREYYHVSETQVTELVCLFISKLHEGFLNEPITFRDQDTQFFDIDGWKVGFRPDSPQVMQGQHFGIKDICHAFRCPGDCRIDDAGGTLPGKKNRHVVNRGRFDE